MLNYGLQKHNCVRTLFKQFPPLHNSLFVKRLLKTSAQQYTNDPYKILGVSKTASTAEIKKKYIELCKQHHPDKTQGSSQEQFVKINAAYSTLSNPQKRREHDNKPYYQSSSYDPRYYSSTTSNRRTQYHKNYRPYPNDRFHQQQQSYYKQRAEYWRKHYKGTRDHNDKTEEMIRDWEYQKAQWERSYQKQKFGNTNTYRKMDDYWHYYYRNNSTGQNFDLYQSYRRRRIMLWLILINIFFCLHVFDTTHPSNNYRNFTPVSYSNPHVGTETIKHPTKEEIAKSCE